MLRILLLALFCGLLPAQFEAAKPVAFKSIDWPGIALSAGCGSIVTPCENPALLVGEFAPAEGGKHVVDGDTLRVQGERQSLRLVGLDTEETFKDKGQLALAERDWNEYLKTVLAGTNPARPPKYASPMGEAARSFAQHFFKDVKTLRVELDDPERGIDYYGRRLTHVLVQKPEGWINFNVEVVRQGLSPYFVKYGRTARHHEAFMAAEKSAQEQKLGIWGAPPLHPAYNDYALRLKWWRERDLALQQATALEKTTPAIVLLGLEREWDQACASAGQTVTVIGGIGKVRHLSKGLGMLPLAHRNQRDFLIVGPVKELEAHALAARDGDILMVTGKLHLYEGRPQFKLEDVSAFRAPGQN